MTKKLIDLPKIDLTKDVDQATIDVYALINQIAAELNISYVVVGATARDLVLHHCYGAPIRRATTDIDFGMQVESWDVFENIRKALIGNGYETTQHPHRLIGPKNTKIDVVPFGALEDKNSNIKWPPKGDFEMSVLGFKEAHDHAVMVVLNSDPVTEVPVATPQGMALLKIISWSERDAELKQKDAEDLVYLLETYEKITSVVDRVYEENIIDNYDWDLTLACAHLLGLDSASIAEGNTKKRILEILEDNLIQDEPSKLIENMSGRSDYNEKLELLKAYSNGFRN